MESLSITHAKHLNDPCKALLSFGLPQRISRIKRIICEQIILAEVLAALRQLVVHKSGQYLLQLKEESFAGRIAIGEHLKFN